MAPASSWRHNLTETRVLDVRHLSKTFVGQRALNDISFDVGAAEVHALVGHNGSGKSTLIKILAGFHRPDDSPKPTVTVAGTVLRFGDPSASRAAGLRFIHQELGLLDRLTVLENLRLGCQWQTRRGRILWSSERRAARASLEQVGLRVSPDALVGDLSAVHRTQLAVARALSDGPNAQVLFFDEPTAMLPSSEVDRLFSVIRSMVRLGISVVYVSHRLEELPQIADRLTILRDGRVMVSGDLTDFTHQQIVEQIVGERRPDTGAPAHRASQPRRKDDIVSTTSRRGLAFEDVHAAELNGASFEVRPGEVVGMAGLVGSGVDDISKVLFGTVALRSGRVLINGLEFTERAPHELLKRRIAVLPSSRTLRSIGGLTVRENLTLAQLESLWSHGRLQLARERAEVAELVSRFNILPRQPERRLAQLSGGNQQKVSVARWLRIKPSVMVLDEPTQGVDIGGKQEILSLLRDAAADGVAILICSSDLEELEEACDRVLVIRKGVIGRELTGTELTREAIAEECYLDVPASV